MSTALVMLSAAAVVLLGLLLLPFSMAHNVLYTNEKLEAGQSLTQGDYTFTMHFGCNLVLYDNGRALWSTNTNGRGNNCFLQMQTDGNLVIYNDNNNAVWASNTWGARGNSVLVLQRDRNVVIYGPGRWSTGTNTVNSKDIVINAESSLNDTTTFTPEVVVPAADEPTNRKIAMVTNN
ncbi:mannose-specific lectin-like [Curcuma longa]|uniref:mannose-specific lectin-like n=1 Tax=Curcuma longa TaxID=136217 RepID=UPI003D9EB2AC